MAEFLGLRGINHKAMQPGVPLRRHARRLDLSVVEDPAPLPLLALRPSVAEVAVAGRVGADELAEQPGVDARSDRHRLALLRRRTIASGPPACPALDRRLPAP